MSRSKLVLLLKETPQGKTSMIEKQGGGIFVRIASFQKPHTHTLQGCEFGCSWEHGVALKELLIKCFAVSLVVLSTP